METEFAYDSLPYSNDIFTQTHPDKLSSVSKLIGVDAPDIEVARVLELGCGKGKNMISQAYSLPNTEFVGIDLAKNHIDYANNSVGELGLTNIDFMQCDLMEMNVEDFGKFDYIIAHGLISWIPDFVREKTFSLYQELLTEKGIGYISYNVYPGWTTRQMMRGISRIHIQDLQHPFEKMENAVSFGKFLAENSMGDELYRRTIQEEVTRYFNSEPPGLFHDHLADINEPYYFYEFAEILYENNLQFISEAQHFTSSVHRYTAEAREFINSMSNIVGREQYIDFFTGRPFRQSIFCRQGMALNRNPSPHILDDLYLASKLSPVSDDLDLITNKKEKFVELEQNEVIEIDHPLTKVALGILGETWGEATECKELLEIARSFLEEKGQTSANWEEEFLRTKQIFLQIIFTSELIEFHSYKVELQTEIGERPKINDLIKWQLKEGDVVSSAYGRVIKIVDPILRNLLEILDGNNTLENLYNRSSQFIKESEQIENKEKVLENLPAAIDNSLRDFAKRGFFTP